MNKNIFLKSIFRKPLKNLLIFVLIGLISFGFITKTAEYIVIDRQIKEASDYYRPIGTVNVDNDSGIIPKEAVDLISKDTSLDYMDISRGFGGAMDGIYSADCDGATEFNNTMFMYATYLGGTLSDSAKTKYPFTNPEDRKTPYRYWYQAEFMVDEVLVGYPENVQAGKKINLSLYANDKKEIEDAIKNFEVHTEYLIKARIGDGWGKDNPLLKPVDSSVYAYKITDGTVKDLSSEAQKEMEAYYENSHTAFVQTTKDMSKLPSMKSIYYLEDGRWLNRQDDLQNHKVCVIRREMAEKRNLHVGDKMTLKIRASEMAYVTLDEEWKEADSIEETYEIVGIFGTTQNETLTMYHSMIYVPDSTIPEVFRKGSDVYSSSFSFVLKSPEDGLTFLENHKDTLADMGCEATFLENGWKNFGSASKSMKNAAVVSLLALALIFVMVTGFSVFFFVHFHKKEWLILNLLGVPRKKVSFQLIASNGLLAVSGILIGGIPAWLHTQARIEEITADLLVPDVLSTVDLPMIYFAGTAAGCFLVWLLMAAYALCWLQKYSLLDNLGEAHIKKAKKIEDKESIVDKTHRAAEGSAKETVKDSEGHRNFDDEKLTVCPSRRPQVIFFIKYVLKHTYRTSFSAALTVIIVFAFIFTSGWLQWSVNKNEQKIDELYDTVEVKGNIVSKTSAFVTDTGGFIDFPVIEAFEQTGYMEDFILEAAALPKVAPYRIEDEDKENEEILWTEAVSRAIDRPEEFLDFKNGRIKVSYLDGYDESFFKSKIEDDDFELEAIISDRLAESFGVKAGDYLRIKVNSARNETMKIVGVYEIGDEGCGYAMVMPMSCLEYYMPLDSVWFSRADYTIKTSENRRLNDVKATLDQIMEGFEGQTLMPLDYVIRDEELTQAIEPLEKNNSIIRVLYPIICIVFTLVCGVMSLLLVLRSSKEAAVLRILGTPKAQVEVLLTLERVFICVLSLMMAGAFTIGILQQAAARAVLQNSLACLAICIAASVAGALIVIRKKPMDLISVKE